MKQLHTHKSLSKLLGVSETTIKSYRRKFPDCIPVASEGKPIQFADVAVKVATRIRDLFATGMSVVEVRQRLSKEFDWITVEELQTIKTESTHNVAEITPELTIGVSNMAKSMVTMTGQQKTILERVKGIEHVLDEIGVQGINLGEQERAQKVQAQRNKEERLEERLAKVDVATQNLANSLASLAHQFQAFVAQVGHSKELQPAQCIAEDNVEQGHATDSFAREKENQRAQCATNTVQPEATRATVVPFEQSVPSKFSTAPFSTSPLSAPLSMQGEKTSEPPRAFFVMPLVVRHGDGAYAYATGRGKGRLCLNDLKAILVHSFTHPYHFALEFEQREQDWWLQVYQPEQQNGHSIGLLLTERMARTGVSVVEITQLQLEGRSVPPVEINTILEKLFCYI